MRTVNTTVIQEIRSIRTAFRRLAHAFAKVQPVLAEAGRVDGFEAAIEKTSRRKPTISAARGRALKLHGSYLGLIRLLPSAKRAKAKKIYAKKGIRAAIAYARGARRDSNGQPRKKPRVSRQQRAAMKLQGKYMGTIRMLPPRQKARVKKIRTAKGIRAAIAAAERVAGL